MALRALDGAEVSGSVGALGEALLCDIIGELGVPAFWNHRGTIFHLSYLLTLFSFAASVFCVVSIARNENAILAVNWSFGDSPSSRLWVGLSGIFWETLVGSSAVTSYIVWTDSACSDTNDNPFCDNCATGGQAAVFLVLLACTTRIPSMMLLRARMNPISDIPLIKLLGMVSEGIAAVCLSGAMFIWREYCHVQLPSQSSITYSYGSGFMMVAAGFCSTFLLFIIHTLMPTEDPYDDITLLDEHIPQCCSSKARAGKSSQVKPESEGNQYRLKRKKRSAKYADVARTMPEVRRPVGDTMEPRINGDKQLGGY